ncbi:MAG: arylsulfatase A-like enzyme [Cyclobacteriaceae bacterium]|jgi:arylsulfatase A-like enzyme
MNQITEKLKFYQLLFLLLLPLLIACNNNNNEEQEKVKLPNVLFINIDDLGWKDLGYMGNDYHETPNIDKLASEGMIFTNGYAGAANCAPSRACLMSGQTTSRHKIFTVGNSDRGNAKTRKIIPTPNNTILSESTITLAEMFKMAGYKTATMGKWHLGEDAKTQGFDLNVAGSHNGSPGKGGYFSPYHLKYLKEGPEGEHLADRLTAEAINFLKTNKDSTFFLYLPYYSVHTPLMAKEGLKEKYKIKKGADAEKNETYAAMVETVDNNIGRLLKSLDEQGLSKNTMVVFTSDNGGIRAVSRQEPLRAGKGSYYEGGIRVPYIVRWPGVVEAGAKNATPIVNMDFFPTFMEIAGVQLPNKILDGKNLLPLLKGGELDSRPLMFHFPIYLQAYSRKLDHGRDSLFRTRPGSIIINGDWKLHQYFEDGGLELYNLKNDLGERNNLAQTNPEKSEELLEYLDNWRKEINAPIPTELNPEFDPSFVPKRKG